jgi:hypothetical protein
MEQHRLRVCENRGLRRIYGSTRDEIKGGWRKVQNEDLHNLYSSQNIIKNDEVKEKQMGKACSKHRRKDNMKYNLTSSLSHEEPTDETLLLVAFFFTGVTPSSPPV